MFGAHRRILLQSDVYNLHIPNMLTPKGLITLPRERNEPHQGRTFILRLKKKVENLNDIILQQQETIQALQRAAKSTKINELQVEIQHLHEENKRLRTMVEQGRRKMRGSTPKQKKTAASCAKITERQTVAEYNFQPKVYQVFQENQCLRKHIITLKAKEGIKKEKGNTINDLSSNILLERNANERDKNLQGKIDLEAEQALLKERVKQLEQKVKRLLDRNEELQFLHHKHICISPAIFSPH